MNNKQKTTNYTKGFKRIVKLLAIGWFGAWAVNLTEEYFSEQHRKLVIFAGNGNMVFTYLTLGNHDYRVYSGSSAVRMLDGERYIFFFDTGDRTSAKAAENWVKNLSQADIEKAKEVAASSRRNVMLDKAATTFGVPLGILLAWLLGAYVYRGFKPKATSPAPKA